ncbi:MAG: hypothetical protein LBR56_08070 [Sporomusaceae bacterium]|jgi:hypothetical protein|nr:hypothetical protein [Sporomusaceae bacterium]
MAQTPASKTKGIKAPDFAAELAATTATTAEEFIKAQIEGIKLGIAAIDFSSLASPSGTGANSAPGASDNTAEENEKKPMVRIYKIPDAAEQSLLIEQGKADPNFLGTCGLVACANIFILNNYHYLKLYKQAVPNLNYEMNEATMLQYALTRDKPLCSAGNSDAKYNGITTMAQMQEILSGYENTNPRVPPIEAECIYFDPYYFDSHKLDSAQKHIDVFREIQNIVPYKMTKEIIEAKNMNTFGIKEFIEGIKIVATMGAVCIIGVSIRRLFSMKNEIEKKISNLEYGLNIPNLDPNHKKQLKDSMYTLKEEDIKTDGHAAIITGVEVQLDEAGNETNTLGFYLCCSKPGGKRGYTKKPLNINTFIECLAQEGMPHIDCDNDQNTDPSPSSTANGEKIAKKKLDINFQNNILKKLKDISETLKKNESTLNIAEITCEIKTISENLKDISEYFDTQVTLLKNIADNIDPTDLSDSGDKLEERHNYLAQFAYNWTEGVVYYKVIYPYRIVCTNDSVYKPCIKTEFEVALDQSGKFIEKKYKKKVGKMFRTR